MRPFIWADHYQKMGIWGCLRCFCKENHCESWGVMFTIFRERDYITSLGQIQNSMLFDVIYEPTINDSKGQGASQYLVPVFLNKKLLFIWDFKTKIQINEAEIKMIKFNLELLILYESYDDERYPSFLVFLYPPMGDMSLVNKEIIESNKRSVVFLNGQEGSGKYTFLQCFLLLHYGHLVQKNNLTQGVNQMRILLANREFHRFIYVPELALLDAEQQVWLLREKNENKNQLIIASVYDSKVLYSHRIISQEIYELCTLNRVILPSLPNRTADIPRLLHFMISVKASNFDIAQALETKQLDKAFNTIIQTKLNLNQVQQEIKKIVSESSPSNSIEKVVDSNKEFVNNHRLVEKLNDKGVHLREIVSKFEVSAIRYAHSRVGNSQHKMSNFLGISRGSLQNKLKKYDLDYDEWSD